MAVQVGVFTLKDYQEDALDTVFHEFDNGLERALVQLPTGTGKTVLMAAIADRAIREKRWPVLMLAHRGELLYQAQEKFAVAGVETMLEKAEFNAQQDMALFEEDRTAEVEVAVLGSIMTMRGDRLVGEGKHKGWRRDRFGLIMVDEAHHIVAKTYLDLLGWFTGYKLLAVTATADRADGKNLGSVFKELDKPVYELPLAVAIALKYLVEIEVERIETGINLTSVKKGQDDVNIHEVAERIGPDVARIAAIIKGRIGTKTTILFAPDVTSSDAFASALNRLGVSAKSICDKDSDQTRKRAIAEFSSGLIQVLCNYGIFTEGFDEPRIEVVVIARPTTSRSLYSQMAGRGTRTWNGPDGYVKEKCILIDLVMGCDTLKLVHPCELFDDSNGDDETIDIAQDLVNRCIEKNLKLAMEMAQGLKAERQAERQAQKAHDDQESYTRQRERIEITAKNVHDPKYRVTSFNPMDMTDLGLISYRKSDFDAHKYPATEEQLSTLRKFKIENPEALSFYGAKRYLLEMYKRRQKGLATPKMVASLVRNGFTPTEARSMKFEEAGHQLSLIFGRA